MKQYRLPIIMLAIFEAVAISLWLTKDNIFYLFNFSYIGLSISLGVFLFIKKFKCSSYCTAAGRPIYADLSWSHLSGKHADRGLLVLSFYRSL